MLKVLNNVSAFTLKSNINNTVNTTATSKRSSNTPYLQMHMLLIKITKHVDLHLHI